MKFSKVALLMSIAFSSGCGVNSAFYEGTETISGGQPATFYMTLVEQSGGKARGTYVAQTPSNRAATVDATFNGDMVTLNLTQQNQTGCTLQVQAIKGGDGNWSGNGFSQGNCGGGSVIQLQFHRVN